MPGTVAGNKLPKGEKFFWTLSVTYGGSLPVYVPLSGERIISSVTMLCGRREEGNTTVT